MTRPCGEFCNPWFLDTYAPVCVCVCVCTPGRGRIHRSIEKGFIHFFFITFISLLTEV